MKVAICQMDIAWCDKRGNLEKIKQMTSEAVRGGAEIIVFPEMALTGFCMNPEIAAEAPDGDIARDLLDFTRGIDAVVVLGISARRDGKYLNQCWALYRGEIRAAYSKINLFSLGGETEAYRPGHQLVSFEFKGRKFGMVICYDLRFASLFSTLSPNIDGGVIVVANWPEARVAHWKMLLAARALDCQAFVIGVNRTGSGDSLKYSGDSMAFSPLGEPLLDFRQDEIVRIVELDFSQVDEFRKRFRVLPSSGQLDCEPAAVRIS